MKQLNTLIKEAQQATNLRDHSSNMHWLSLNNKTATGICHACKKRVFVDANPMSGDNNIRGEAVVLHCNV